METISPKESTLPSGAHRGDLLMIMGTTPTAAAADVRKIGRILRFAAATAAALMV